MKLSTPLLVGAAALASLLSLNAHAEQYQGVLQFHSTATRAEVRSQAVAAAHSTDPYREGAYADAAPAFMAEADRKAVKLEARAAAREDNPYGDVAADGVEQIVHSTVDRTAVRADARAAAARGVSDGLR